MRGARHDCRVRRHGRWWAVSHLVVVGDALLDRDVMDLRDGAERPGGAGLAAVFAARAGVHVILLAAISDDAAGLVLRSLLLNAGVDVPRWRDPAPTAEQERVRVHGRPLVRLDRSGAARELPTPPILTLSALAHADAVLVADYGRGVAANNGVRHAIAAALRRGVPVVWDPHPKGVIPTAGAALVTPNAAELAYLDARAMGGALSVDLERVIAGARRLREVWRSVAIAVTRGASGAVLVSHDGAPLVVPVDDPEPDVSDTYGAG